MGRAGGGWTAWNGNDRSRSTWHRRRDGSNAWASALQPDAGGLAGVPLARPLLYALFAVLALEQLVAFAAGYHPVSSRSAAARPTV
jgi:hypothetical protein